MAQLVKTVQGLAIASVKTAQGLAIASAKTIMGVDNTSGGGGQDFSDNFDRADGALGANWTAAAGTAAIFSNTWRQGTGSYGNCFSIYSATACDTVINYGKITFSNNSGEFGGMVMRYVDASNKFYAFYMDQNAVWTWNTYASAAGGSTELASGDGGTFTSGDSWGITITGTGASTVIRFWKNPVANTSVSASEWDSGDTTPELTFSGIDPGANNADTGKIIGLTAASSAANNVRLDNFFGGDC
jgi:hypothetical protein